MTSRYKTPLLVLICLLLGIVNKCWSQQIKASDSTGCAPFYNIQFTGIPGATSINWNFGDGGSSGILNPTHTFSNPGNFTVTFTANVSGSPVTQTIPIKVFGKPTSKFTTSSPKKGCAPLSVTFTDQSTGGGGSVIVGWKWAFGDGGVNTSNNPNPTYVYNLTGQFNVSLIVTDANGCDSSYVIPQYIATSKKPTIVVTPSGSITACVPPLTTTFSGSGTTSNSTTGSALTYFWNFGNSTTSTSVSPPAVTYTALGTFPVKFIATDNNGCSDSIIKNVIISNPVASFSVNDTVCKTVVFTNTSTGGVATWNYGDGVTNGTSTTHTYASAGTYSVTLTVKAGTCTDDTIRKIVVEDIKAKFSSVPQYVCDLPAAINFVDQSTNASIWKWTFTPSMPYLSATPGTSAVQNPIINFSSRDTNQYSIYKEEYVGVKLVVTSLHGCKDSITVARHDTINLPTARFMPDTTQGCVPLLVQFSDSSISKETIVNWKYVFGDGTVLSGNTPNPSHTYTAAGTYYAMLIIQNSKGCIDTSYSIKIVVGKLPTPDFSATPLVICPGDPVQFTDLTPLSDSIDTWHYSTDGSFIMSACPGTANPIWNFVASTGTQSVTLTVGSHGCYASITKSNYLTVKGPIAQFATATDCDSPRVYVFTGILQDASHWTWDMGDGNVFANSTSSTITHTYAASGNYKVKLTAYNTTSGCAPSVDTATAYVRQLKAALFDPDTIFCAGTQISFDASPSVDVNADCNSGYYWLWGHNAGPGIYSTPKTTHTFPFAGYFNVKLIVKDINGCRDTLVRNVRASGLTPKFTQDKKYGCLPFTVNFTDLSSSDTTITDRTWTFGDGGTGSGILTSHTYTANTPSAFIVTETVVNKIGCTSTATVLITPSKPDSTFSASKTTLCAGDSVKFTPAFINHTGYVWNFGDGTPVSSVKSPTHIFTQAGDYAITLQVTDSIGCKGTKKLFNYIHVQGVPKVGFFSDADTTLSTNCYPLQVNFTDTSIVNIFLSRKWDLGTGQPVSTSPTVGWNYTLPGTYAVTLTVTTTYGCKSSLTKNIKVNGPVGDFSFSPSVICKGSAVQFNIKDTSSVFTYHWDFGDGYDTTAISPISHTFNHHPPNGQAQITLVYWSSDSSCTRAVSHNLAIHQVTADFDRNNEMLKTDTAHCLNIPDLFTNNSLSATTWAWDFGDGTTSSTKSPAHTYTAAGTYSVQLSIKDNVFTCVDTLIKTMVIYPNPVVTSTGGDTCAGSPIQMTSSGGISYLWTPSDGLSSTTISNPVATPSVTTNYTVLVTDTNSCTKEGIATVYIQQAPEEIDWDTTIIIGQSVTLNAVYQGGSFTYIWSPADSLSCSTCSIPTILPLIDKYFTVIISDTVGCFSKESHIHIYVLPKASVDVPSVFTPNGDGINDVIFVDGWGIKNLLEFKIYNRWGELLFLSTNLKDGWDGTYKGVPQNIETYAYTVIVETYVNKEPLTKKGYIKIIK